MPLGPLGVIDSWLPERYPHREGCPVKPGHLCAQCKGRGMCGLPRCPVMERFHASVQVKQADSYMGGAPSVFVGAHGYPKVTGGPLLIGESDNPEVWVEKAYTIDDIVGVRSRTIRGNSAGASRGADAMQEIALSAIPLDVEVAFTRPVAFDLRFDGTIAPVGLSGDMKKINVLDNAKTPRPVDRAVSDTDLLASDAVWDLYRDGIGVHQVSQLLSAGLLGKQRKVVPTRWSITAVDDMLGKAGRAAISHNSALDQYLVFTATLHGNTIVCILTPGDFRYEMIEHWQAGSMWGGQTGSIMTDAESRKGKSGYSPIAGAYYSARLAVLDYLRIAGKTARAIVIRSVAGSYWAPLGTWVIREAARQAMAQPPVVFEDLTGARAYAAAILGTDAWESHSSLLQEIATQKNLFDFF